MANALAPYQERSLARAAAAGDRRARERLIEASLPLVAAIARGFHGLGLPTADLVQEGAAGLTAAADRFEPDRGVPFGNYAAWSIRRAILRALTEQTRTVRLPSYVIENQRRIRQAQAALRASLGRPPTPEEVAAESGLDLRTVDRATSALEVRASLNQTLTTDGVDLVELVADRETRDPLDLVADEDRADAVRTAVAALPPREREVVERHFGFGGSTETLDEVAAELGVARERARQLEQHALASLARALDE